MENLIFDTENFNKYNNNEYKKNFRYYVDPKKNIYFGGESNKRRNWIGKMIYNNGDGNGGDIYEGYWKNHKKHGFGIMKYANGNIYQGFWECDKKNGEGEFTDNTGKYKGIWKNDIKIGFGKMEFKEHQDFISFEGEWENDNFIKGKVVYKNGEIYDGDFINKIKDGFGKLLYKKGQIYEGQWKNNKRNGNGTYIFESGSVYIGQWVDGERNGHGILNYNGGSIYCGNWVNNTKYGYGEMEYANGNIYKGEWDDEKYGKGKMIYANGDVYDGEWNDEKTGKGKMIYANGDVYDGEWEYNVRNGKGILIFKNGDNIETKWKNDKKNGIALFISGNKKYIQSWDKDNKLDEIELDSILCSEITINNIDDIDNMEIKIMNERELSDDDLVEIRCPISFEYLFNPVVTKCNHIFSKKSLDQYMVYKNECPLCRCKVTSYDKLRSISGYQNIESIAKKCMFTINNKEIEFEKIIRLKNFI